jgi:hypothetical protein
MTRTDVDTQFAELAASPPVDECDVVVVDPPEPSPLADLAAATRAAQAAPLDSPPLRELAGQRAAQAAAAGRDTRAVIITSDATRAVPSAKLLPLVLEELSAGGIDAGHVDVVIGTGAHRAATDAELHTILGGLYGRVVVQSHDARAASLVEAGRSRRGTPVLVNRTVAEADLRIALGEVEPHEFAGFTGGRKAILPAVAGDATIVANHALEMLTAPGVGVGLLDGNIVHEEMVEACRLAGLDFIVNVTIDRRLEVTAVAAGGPEAAHADLVGSVRRHAGVTLERRPDVIVCGPDRPLDINLYQGTKTLTSIKPVVGPLTAVVFVSPCHEGVGADEMLEPFVGATGAGDAFAALRRRYVVEHNGACMLALFLDRCPTVLAACPGVGADDLRTLLLHPVADARAGLEQALGVADAAPRESGRRPLVAFIPRAQRLLLSLAGE